MNNSGIMKILIVLVFFSFLCSNVFAQENQPGAIKYNTDPNAPENVQPGSAYEKKPEAGVKPAFEKLFIGFKAGFGLSRQTSVRFTQGEIYTKIATSFAPVLWYFPLENFGLEAELGWHYLSMREEDTVNNDYLEYGLHYVYISAAPLLKFSDIYFSFGVYFGFIMPGTKVEGSGQYDSDLDRYTIPDFGIKMSAGYSFVLSGKTKMFVGISFKAQVFNFRIYPDSGAKLIAFLLNVGVLFNP